MAPYNASQLGKKEFRKYVRLGEAIYVGVDEYVGHKKIVEQDGLVTGIEVLKSDDPKQLDAGLLSVRGRELSLSDSSETLNLPVTAVFTEARQISREIFAAQSPNHTVFGLERR